MTHPSSDADHLKPHGRSLPPLRSDVEITRREVAAGAEYILRDPLSNQHFRLDEEEWFIARLLDGRRTLEQVHARALQQFPEINLPVEEVAAFVRRLAAAGVLRLNGRQDLDRLLAQRRRGRLARCLGLAGTIFYLRLPGINPDRFISWLTPRLAFLLTPAARTLAVLLVLLALALAAWQGHRLGEPRAEFLSPRGLLYLFLAIIFVKVIHELAHACACKHYGGRVTEMGLVFIVFTPCLYCDVSDAWAFPSRRQRLAVTAAGVAVEFLLAAVAAILFFLTRQGWLHQAAFSLMVVAGVSTLLFNGNPLLRYDGYYLLSDWLDVPNLRIRARRYAAALGRRLLFGDPLADPDRPRRHRIALLAYAVASYLYGWFILYAILGLIYRRLEPYGLQGLAAALIAACLAVQLGLPLCRLLVSLARLARRPAPPARFLRPALIAAVAVLLAAVLLRLPFNEPLSRACVIAPSQALDVRAPWAGFISEVHVRPGQMVAPGDRLVTLRSPDLELDAERSRRDRQENQVLLARARAAGNEVQVQQLEIQARQLDQLCEDALRKLQDLELTAWSGGVVLTENLHYQVGCYVNKGDLLVRLASPGQVKVTLELLEREAERVCVGAVASLRIRSDSGRLFRGSVTANSRAASANAAAVLTTLYEGEVPVRRSDEGWRSAEKVYRAELEILDSSLALRPGMSGRARIHLGRTTVGAYLWRTLRNHLSLEVLLKWTGA